jgi:hypothetical protein
MGLFKKSNAEPVVRGRERTTEPDPVAEEHSDGRASDGFTPPETRTPPPPPPPGPSTEVKPFDHSASDAIKPPPATAAAKASEAADVAAEEAPQASPKPRAPTPTEVDLVAHTRIEPRGYVRFSDGMLLPAWWDGPAGEGARPGEIVTRVLPTLLSDLPEVAREEIRSRAAIAVVRPGQEAKEVADIQLL